MASKPGAVSIDVIRTEVRQALSKQRDSSIDDLADSEEAVEVHQVQIEQVYR